MKNAALFVPSSKYRRLKFTTKKIVDQSLESLNLEVIYFLLCLVF